MEHQHFFHTEDGLPQKTDPHPPSRNIGVSHFLGDGHRDCALAHGLCERQKLLREAVDTDVKIGLERNNCLSICLGQAFSIVACSNIDVEYVYVSVTIYRARDNEHVHTQLRFGNTRLTIVDPS